jgi:hypothetical protein
MKAIKMVTVGKWLRKSQSTTMEPPAAIGSIKSTQQRGEQTHAKWERTRNWTVLWFQQDKSILVKKRLEGNKQNHSCVRDGE